MSRVGSSFAAPRGARLLGGLLALGGIALLIVGVLALTGGDPTPPGAAPAPTATASRGPDRDAVRDLDHDAGDDAPGHDGAAGDHRPRPRRPACR